MTLPEKLDRAVHAARLDFMTPHGAPRPRNLRWLPLLALLALPTGYVLLFGLMPAMARGGGAAPAFWLGGAGMLLFTGALLLGAVLPFFGPRVGHEAQGLDERELLLRARAGSAAGLVVANVAMLGCFYLAAASALQLWTPSDAAQWAALGFAVFTGFRLLPILIASWLQPASQEEDSL